MKDFDAIQTSSNQLRDQGFGAAYSGVGQYHHPADSVHHGDDIFGSGVGFSNDRGLPVSDIALKGLFLRGHGTTGDQRRGNMGSSQDSAGRLIENILDSQLDAQVVKAFHDGNTTGVPALAKQGQVVGQGLAAPVDEIGQQVNLAPVSLGGQFGTRNECYSQVLPSLHSFSDAGNRVVVGQPQNTDPSITRLFDCLRRCAQAIRAVCMDVKIR